MSKQHYVVMLVGGLLIGSSTALAKDGDIKAEGALSAYSASSATVRSLTCTITGQTEFENANGSQIPASSFSVGDRVEMKCVQVGGELLVRELELKQDNTSGISPSPSASPSFRDDDRRGSRGDIRGRGEENRDRRYRARLAKIGDSSARGKFDYRIKKKENRLQINVKVPLPSIVPPIADEAEADGVVVQATLLRDSVAYAVCDLGHNDNSDDSDDDDSLQAEYKLDVRQRIGRELKMKKGGCDTDVETAGIQSGLPAVEVGDLVQVHLEDEAPFLEGTVQRKH